MAYWMTHLRVAEALLRCLPEGISLPHYYAGSIAPDCGRTEWNEDGTPRYLPGRVVTHWLKKDEALDRCLIDFEGFYNAMMPQAADDGPVPSTGDIIFTLLLMPCGRNGCCVPAGNPLRILPRRTLPPCGPI